MLYSGRLAVLVVVFLLLTVTVYASLVFLLGARLDMIVEKPIPLLMYVGFSLLGELFRALRLKIVYWRITGVHPSLLRSFLARLAGNIVSSLTPSAIGGEVIRGAVAAGARGIEEHSLTKLVAAGLADGLYDLFTNTLLALVFIPILGASFTTGVPLILGITASASWILVAKSLSSEKRARILRILGPRAPAIVVEGSQAFLIGLDAKARTESTLLSIAAWITTGIGFYFLANSYCNNTVELLNGIAVLLYTFLMGIIPVPAGLGSMDLWLAVNTCPTTATAWRTALLVQLLLSSILVTPLAASELRLALRFKQETTTKNH